MVTLPYLGITAKTRHHLTQETKTSDKLVDACRSERIFHTLAVNHTTLPDLNESTAFYPAKSTLTTLKS